MKIGVISDTHLHKVTKELKKIYDKYLSDKDLILHAGDIVSPEIVAFLSRKDFHGVHGNMDPPELRTLLPEKVIFEKAGVTFGLTHGWGAPYDLEERVARLFNNEDVNCIIYGHSHNGVSHKRDDILFFNPGSPTDRHFAKANSIGYLTIENGELRGEIVTV